LKRIPDENGQITYGYWRCPACGHQEDLKRKPNRFPNHKNKTPSQPQLLLSPIKLWDALQAKLKELEDPPAHKAQVAALLDEISNQQTTIRRQTSRIHDLENQVKEFQRAERELRKLNQQLQSEIVI
jgi:uncharacterized Zn finger protein (UPF0148 family)